MSCKACEEANQAHTPTVYIRWKNADVGLVGCQSHIAEIVGAIHLMQQIIQEAEQLMKSEGPDGPP